MKSDYQPVFVVGVFRSGTSLLYSLLNQHPNLALMYETDVWNFPRAFSGWRFRGDWLARQEFFNQCLSRHRLTLNGTRRGLESIRTPDDLYDTYAQLKPAARCGEKSPHYCSRLEELFRQYPQAAFIILWRDPVETYRSVVKAGKKAPFFRKIGMLSRLVYRQEDLIRQTARIQARGARVFRVSYDGLVDEPETVCRQLCGFLELEFDDQMLRLENADMSSVYRDPHHDYLRRGIIARQRHAEELLKPAEIAKLASYRTRWERLQAPWLGVAPNRSGKSEPAWFERHGDFCRGRFLALYDDGVRLGFEFLPLAWLQAYRNFRAWLLNKPPALMPATAHPANHTPSLITALVYLMMLATVHLHADPHLMFLPLYILPCLALALVTNLQWATLFSIMCAILAPLVQGFNSAEYEPLPVMLWNSSMRFLLIEMLVLLFVRIRREITQRHIPEPLEKSSS